MRSPLLIAIAAATLLTLTGCDSGPPKACLIDDEIASDERGTFEKEALAFVKDLLGTDPARAHQRLSEGAAAKVSAEDLAVMMKRMNPTPGTIRDPVVEHIYRVAPAASDKPGAPNVHLACGEGANSVTVEAVPGETQAHVLLKAKTANAGVALTVWLVPQSGGWKANAFYLNTRDILGHDTAALLAMARAQRGLGNGFNAALLYVGAQNTANRGPWFETGAAKMLAGDLKTLKLPPELQGNAPFHWTMRGHSYTVASVTMLTHDTRLGLVFVLPQTAWSDSAAADAFNRQFISDFVATHPAYKDTFGFLVARAMKPDNSGGYGTAYEAGKGFAK